MEAVALKEKPRRSLRDFCEFKIQLSPSGIYADSVSDDREGHRLFIFWSAKESQYSHLELPNMRPEIR